MTDWTYSDKLAHVQVVINCRYSIAQMCTWEDTHARLFTRAVLDGHESVWAHNICLQILWICFQQNFTSETDGHKSVNFVQQVFFLLSTDGS